MHKKTVVATSDYFHYQFITLDFKVTKNVEKCSSKGPRAQNDTFKCLILCHEA